MDMAPQQCLSLLLYSILQQLHLQGIPAVSHGLFSPFFHSSLLPPFLETETANLRICIIILVFPLYLHSFFKSFIRKQKHFIYRTVQCTCTVLHCIITINENNITIVILSETKWFLNNRSSFNLKKYNRNKKSIIFLFLVLP